MSRLLKKLLRWSIGSYHFIPLVLVSVSSRRVDGKYNDVSCSSESCATTEQGVLAVIERLHITPQTRKQNKYNVNCIKKINWVHNYQS